jgi:cytochrome P450
VLATKRPSDFPRSERFRDPRTPPFRDEQGVYHVFSYADVMRVLHNREWEFSRDHSWLPSDIHHMAFDFMWAVEPFTPEGEEGRHDPLRTVVEEWFRTSTVRTFETKIRELTAELLNNLVARGTGEFNLPGDLAYRLSMRVICWLTGIELGRERWLREKLDEFSQVDDYRVMPRQWDAEAYFWQMIAKRLAKPEEELLDVLIAAWKNETISDRELLGYLFGFVAAGTDTTGTSFVNAFALLSEFGLLDEARAMLDDQDAMRRLVEEVLRFATPFPKKPLQVVKDCSFGELDVPAGSGLYIWFAAANRDEAVNGGQEQSSPGVFDPRRWPNRHVALGWGKHICLGNQLARLEIRILLQEALRRLPGLHLDESRPFKRFAGVVDGVTEATFRFDQERAEQIMLGDGVAG